MNNEILKSFWPDWEIEGEALGRGSFGTVYKAVRRDDYMESFSAIKVVSIPTDPSEIDSLRSEGLDLNATRTYLQQVVTDFVDEIRLMTSLKGSPNIVGVEDYKVVEKTDTLGWDIYIRMELLKPLNSYMRNRALTEKEVIKLGCDICSALETCQQQKIIHRDIKPENIFVNYYGNFKLGDFGIARKLENITGSLSRKGSPNYMAPEVARGNIYDSRVDICSLGIVLYRLMNQNRLPFIDRDSQLLSPTERERALNRRLQGEPLPAPCNASPAFADVILKACAFDPDQRYATATEMKKALLRLEENSITAPEQEVQEATIFASSPTKETVVVVEKTEHIQRVPETVDSFNTLPKKQNKPHNLRVILAACLAVLIGAGLFLATKFIDNSGGNTPSSSSTSSGPTILAEPKDVYAGDGAFAVAIVDTAEEDLRYEWWISEPGDGKYYKSSQRTNAYMIEMTPDKDGRKAYCIITNPNGESVSTKTVTFHITESEIAITQAPTDVVSSMGLTAKVPLFAEGTGLTYEWWATDPGDTKYYKSRFDTNLYKATMTELSAGRKVFCIITDRYGNTVATKPITITVE